MITNKFKAGVIQFDIINGDINANMDKALYYLGCLADQGGSLGVLPELFASGFDNENIRFHARTTQDCLDRLAQFAKKRSMAVAGTFARAEGDKVFNTLYFIDQRGEIKGAYDKLHLFRLTCEDAFYTPGNKAVVIDTVFGRVGLMICYDLRFPELARHLFIKGAKICIVCAQWPSPRKAHWQTLIQARAIENQAFFICSNRTGEDEDLVFPGLSAIVDPWGKILAQADDDPGTITAGVDMGEVDRARALIPIIEDRREDIYG
ncbi:MAG: carbon-nitrogen family hydrolase [Desulfobacter sp.]|nr:carbon-nitrogen family hydrolase [Desulfobacter sp.]WDP86946.1 MAG: carbon-nitrogen family hydrolase [Desulfobacter sp.]